MPSIIWSHPEGKRASAGQPSSRVRVYERADNPGRFFMSRAWSKTANGHAEEVLLKNINSKTEAEEFCEQTYLEPRTAILAGQAEGRPGKACTVGHLLDRYHRSAKAKKWGDRHRFDQEGWRRFWISQLGADRAIISLTPDEVESIAAHSRDENDWKPRTEERALQYLTTATRWGRRKANLYERDPLGAVEPPEYESDNSELAYSSDAIRALIAPRPDVDWRVTLVANIAYDTGRRLSAIRHLKADPIDSDLVWAICEDPDTGKEAKRLLLRFRKEHDKKGNNDVSVPVSTETQGLVVAALEQQRVRESGWLIPGRRQRKHPEKRQPASDTTLIKKLHHAERTLGIPHVKHRAYHGIKRRSVTQQLEVSEGDYGPVKNMTGNRSEWVLGNVYRQPERRRMLAQVDATRNALADPSRARRGT